MAKLRAPADTLLRLRVDSPTGKQIVTFRSDDLQLPVLRVTTTLTPSTPLLIPYFPRDLYPLGAGDDPMTASGRVEAAQRGLNSGLLYFHLDKPAFGSVLYFQNLTALNDYFPATRHQARRRGRRRVARARLSAADAAAKRHAADQSAAGGRRSHHVRRHPGVPRRSRGRRAGLGAAVPADARRGLSAARRCRATEYRDWVSRAERTLRDLDDAPEATIRHYGHRYIHPYTAAEYPDIMVQMSVIAALHDYAAWTRQAASRSAKRARSRARASSTIRKLKTMRRYLPNVGDDKDKPTRSTAGISTIRCSTSGTSRSTATSRRAALFVGSLDFGIKAAHHFDYKWPIQFKVDRLRGHRRGAQRRRPAARPMSAGSMPRSCSRPTS